MQNGFELQRIPFYPMKSHSPHQSSSVEFSGANRPAASMRRRAFLEQLGGGFGSIALMAMLGNSELSASSSSGFYQGVPPSRPKARKVIHLFMNGGVSPMDTFDYKPQLDRLHGERFDPGAGKLVESVTNSPGFKVLKSPFAFQRHGQCGQWVSEVFPHMASIVDELSFIQSMTSTTNVHGLASYMQNTGFTQPGFPSVGSWVSYALGEINQNLPSFVVLPDPKGLPYNNLGNFTSGFLPLAHEGVVFDSKKDQPVDFLNPPETAKGVSGRSERDGRDLLSKLNQRHQLSWEKDGRLDARIESYEMAARMQLSVPELFDLSDEPQSVRKLYGLDQPETEDFARRCIWARRMIERDVRFVQVWSGMGGPKDNWDNHANIHNELPYMTRQVDQPITALIQDLKSRGMLEDTLVVWTTEFGRMPFSQGESGRDHNGGTFVTWMAGGGTQPGTSVGRSDEWGWKAEEPIWCYDLHATMLHLLGINHEKLTVRHQGIDRRLTNVHGRVLTEILS